MYVYVFVFICVCVRVCVCAEYIHTCIHTYIQIYIHTYNIPSYINTYTHTHTYIHTYMHTYIHTYIHTYTYTYIHTYSTIRIWDIQGNFLVRTLSESDGGHTEPIRLLMFLQKAGFLVSVSVDSKIKVSVDVCEREGERGR